MCYAKQDLIIEVNYAHREKYLRSGDGVTGFTSVFKNHSPHSASLMIALEIFTHNASLA